MKNNESKLLIQNESGAALLQVVFIGMLIGLMSYIGMQMMTNADKSNLRIIRRNENLTTSILLSDQMNDKRLLKDLGTTPFVNASGTVIQYE